MVRKNKKGGLLDRPFYLDISEKNGCKICPFGNIIPRMDSKRHFVSRSFKKALKLHQDNMLDEAEKLYLSILRICENHPDASNNLAVLLFQSGKGQRSLPYFKKAIRADPANEKYRENYIQALISLGQFSKARQILAQSRSEGFSGPKFDLLFKTLEKRTHFFDFKQVQKFFKQGQYDLVEKYCREYIGENSDEALALKCLGSALVAQKKYKEALPYMKNATQLLPDDADGHNSLGVLLKNLGRLADAENSYRRALEIISDYPHALNNLAVLLQERGDPEEAKALLLKAIALRPDYPEACFNLGNAYKGSGNFIVASQYYRRALQQRPDYADAHMNLGAVLQEMGDLDEAEDCYLTALKINPDSPELLKNMAALSQTRGELEGAEKYCLQAIRLRNDYAEAYYILSELNKLPNEKRFFDILVKILSDNREFLTDRLHAHFTLGKMFADGKQYDKAFSHYAMANECREKKFGIVHDPAIDDQNLQFFVKYMTKDFFLDRKNWGIDSRKPIFIVGMPRSGTTLIEQILSSHSQVCGAGELPYIKDYLSDFAGKSGNQLTGSFLLDIQGEDAKKIGSRYLMKLSEKGGDSLRVTDKMPHNFESLWLIALLFPHATVIHSARNPVDTCLSCFFQNFSSPHAYKNDLDSLARHYRYYQAVMKHWKEVLPVEIHDIVYEEMVFDPKKQIPGLLEVCGLEFDPDCMAFYKNRRIVQTASSVQVRQEIYQSSVEKWRKYEKHIAPLVDLLK